MLLDSAPDVIYNDPGRFQISQTCAALERWQHDRWKICCNVVTMLNVEL